MRKKIIGGFSYLKQVFSEFVEDDVLKYSASLAYYTIFSIAPVIIVIISVCGVLFGKEAIQNQLYGQINELVGSSAATQIQDTIKNIHLTGSNIFATIVGIIVLLIGATGIFGEVQDSLNKFGDYVLKKEKYGGNLFLTDCFLFL